MPSEKIRLISCFLTQEQLGVAVAQEAEIVCQGVVIHAAPPVLAHKGRHEQQQCRLRLVEVGNHAVHDAVLEARGNHQLGAAHVGVGMVAVQVIDDVLKCFLR